MLQNNLLIPSKCHIWKIYRNLISQQKLLSKMKKDNKNETWYFLQILAKSGLTTVYEKLSKTLWNVKLTSSATALKKNNGNLFLIFSVMAEKFPDLATFEITEGTTYFNETIK